MPDASSHTGACTFIVATNFSEDSCGVKATGYDRIQVCTHTALSLFPPSSLYPPPPRHPDTSDSLVGTQPPHPLSLQNFLSQGLPLRTQLWACARPLLRFAPSLLAMINHIKKTPTDRHPGYLVASWGEDSLDAEDRYGKKSNRGTKDRGRDGWAWLAAQVEEG